MIRAGFLLPLLAIGAVVAADAAAPRLTFVTASETPLANPHDLKLSPDGKHLFVSDVGNNRVAILDPETLDLVASFGADHQSGTHDVDFDSAGRVYVADTHNNRVTIYELDGFDARLVGELRERIRGPEGVLVHPDGRVYVAGAWSGNLVAYDGQRAVAELGGLRSPHDVELAHDGRNIWVADAGNDRLLLLSPELEILEELGGPKYEFNGVRYLDLTADGMLIAADKNNHVIKFIGADRELRFVLGEVGESGRGIGRFRTPEGVEVRGEDLWLSDSGNDRVVRYRLR